MKKLIAFLSVCAMITCNFASCGKDEAEESNEKSVSVSEAETSETKTEEETTEEETTTEPLTEEETTETTTESENSVSDVVGMWYTEYEDGTFLGFNIKADGKIDTIVDVTEITHFTADGGFFWDGDILNAEYIDYDGDNLIVSVNDKDIFNMVAVSTGDADCYDGEYTLKSGSMYDSMSNGGNYDTGIVINHEMMFVIYRNAISYKTDKGIVSLSGLKNLDYDFDTSELEYKVSGDTLTLFDAENDGSDLIMKKFDFLTYKPSVKTSTESNTPAEKTTSAENEVSTEKTVSDDNRTPDSSIIGMWLLPDDSSYGFSFEEDMTGGIFVDATETVHFTSDGKFFVSSMTLEPENISYDGTNLTISLADMEILSMTRNDGNNPDSFDGLYTFSSGLFYDEMIPSMCDSFGIDEENAVLYCIVTGEQMYIEFAKIFEYSTENGIITLSGQGDLAVLDGSTAEYKISGDKLIMTDPDGTEETFEKFKLS